MTYRSFLPWANKTEAQVGRASLTPDDRSGDFYLEDPALRLAAETAIVTRRPLLLRGEPGSGKSSFAPFAARNLNWRYYETTVTGRTQARELLWRFDALSRLRDAQDREADVSAARYVDPGVMWWAFNAEDAREFVREVAERAEAETRKRPNAPLPRTQQEALDSVNVGRDALRAVVLIDELDKADPDVPNDLLEAFGLNRFVVEETGRVVARRHPEYPREPQQPGDFGSLLVVITTNDERELPAAFLRRCVVHRLAEPLEKQAQVERWRMIARLHEGMAIAAAEEGETLVEAVAVKCWELRQQARAEARRPPSTAEFLDAVRACLWLKIRPSDALWQAIASNVLLKATSSADERPRRGTPNP